MYLHQSRKPNGDIYLTIKEKYHVPKNDPLGRRAGSHEMTIESLGYVSELSKKYADPVEYYKRYVEMLNNERTDRKEKTISIDTTSTLEIGTNDVRNVGYVLFKTLYKDLKMDTFWNWKTRGRKMEFSTDQIFRLLVFSRPLIPGSKRYTLMNKGYFFEPFQDMSLDDIYHAMDVIAEQSVALQEWMYQNSQSICERDLSVGYFDCTNYYYDIGRPDVDDLDEAGQPVDKDGNPVPAKYRKRGPEKNHRPDPIVELGLLLDRNGIPVAFELFPGNDSEKLHLRPVVDRVKQKYHAGRVIVVADRGLNTSDNIYKLNGDNKGDYNPRDGYVYGQSIRGADAEFKQWVLSGGYQKDKIKDDDGNDIVFVHKSRIAVKTIRVNVTKPGSKKTVKKNVDIDQKQMVYYSEKYAKKQKADRDAMIARAKDLIKYPKKYDRVTAKGSAAYVLNIAFDKNTGEVVESRNLALDLEKIQEEEKYDGYYSIVTSELQMPDLKMRELYRGLAHIEDCFKVTKTFFHSRPIYVTTNEHIEAHFTVCFAALVLTSLLELKLNRKFPLGQILNSIKSYNCTQIDKNYWQFTYYDEILDSCATEMELDLNLKYRTRQEIQRLLRY